MLRNARPRQTRKGFYRRSRLAHTGPISTNRQTSSHRFHLCSNVDVPAILPRSRNNQLQGQPPLTSMVLQVTTTTTTTHPTTRFSWSFFGPVRLVFRLFPVRIGRVSALVGGPALHFAHRARPSFCAASAASTPSCGRRAAFKCPN